jgi:hypothetical protein
MLKEEKTMGQLAAEYGVSTKQLGRWKIIALENLPRLKVDPKVKTRKPKFKVLFTPCLFNISLIR